MKYSNPTISNSPNGYFKIKDELTVFTADNELDGAAETMSYVAYSTLGISIRSSAVANLKIEKADLDSEEYEIDTSEEGITVRASTKRGVIYAFASLILSAKRTQTSNGSELLFPCGYTKDKPHAEMRGVHVYMPAKNKIEEFKRLIDCLALLKMNTLIIEVGGGMEYKRHPEINTAWEKFCKEIDALPGIDGSRSFQGSDMYWKDSLHTELAGGSFLTQNEVRDIVIYAKAHGLDVIPEIPSLSHSYYLAVAHPEIAELSSDPFPDTYCPSNEKSYELYFDVADEVLSVFEPKLVSIGHDEIRVLGWCDKCRNKSGHELVGGDIKRLHDFYKSRGVRIAMWAESAQTFISYKGSRIGGSDEERVDCFGRYYKLPATCNSIDMLPNDILMLDWYYSLGHTSEAVFAERGFDVIFGNFQGSVFGEFDERSRRGSIKGAEVSTWCSPTEETLAKDGLLYEFAFSSHILWSDDYSNDKYDSVVWSVRQLMPYLRAVYKGERSSLHNATKLLPVFLGTEDTGCKSIDLSTSLISDPELERLVSDTPTLWGRSVDEGILLIEKEFYADTLVFLHNAKSDMPFYPSYYAKDKRIWGLGAYAISYEDGDFEFVNVSYGSEIGASSLDYSRHRDGEKKGLEIDIDITDGDVASLPCIYTPDHVFIKPLTYLTTPIIGSECTVFAYEWKNPHPNKKITKIRPYTLRKDYSEYFKADRSQAIVLFGIFAAK